MASTELPKQPRRVGIFDAFVAKRTQALILKERILSLSGNSWDMKLADGQPLLRVAGRTATLRARRSVYDMDNNHLFDLLISPLHLHTTFVLERPSGERIMEVRNKIKFVGSSAKATFKAIDGQTQTLKMKGSLGGVDAIITDESTGAVVASIDRDFPSAARFFSGARAFVLVVNPGVDMALIAAMCMCLRSQHSDQFSWYG